MPFFLHIKQTKCINTYIHTHTHTCTCTHTSTYPHTYTLKHTPVRTASARSSRQCIPSQTEGATCVQGPYGVREYLTPKGSSVWGLQILRILTTLLGTPKHFSWLIVQNCWLWKPPVLIMTVVSCRYCLNEACWLKLSLCQGPDSLFVCTCSSTFVRARDSAFSELVTYMYRRHVLEGEEPGQIRLAFLNTHNCQRDADA